MKKILNIKTTIKPMLILAGLFALLNTAFAQEKKPVTQGTPTVLPRPDFHFQGNVGRTYKDSDPGKFPQPVEAPKGAPNVVLILIDDAGFGQFSTFGGGVPSYTNTIPRDPKGEKIDIQINKTLTNDVIHFFTIHLYHHHGVRMGSYFQ